MTVPDGGPGAVQNIRPHQLFRITEAGGLLVHGGIDGLPTKFVIDTGAAVSLVSCKTYEALGMGKNLQNISCGICGADGRNIKTQGQTMFEVTIGPLKVDFNMIVADVQTDVILGMDFLLEYNCKVDLASQHLIIDRIPVMMWQEGISPSQCRIIMKDDLFIPAKCEVISLGQVRMQGSEAQFNVIENNPKFVEKYGLLLARTLIDIRKGVVPIRILNGQPMGVQVHRGTVIGFAEPADECPAVGKRNIVGLVAEEELTVETSQGETINMPEHMQELVDKCSKNLATDEKNRLIKTLQEFEHVFVGKDNQLGRTSLVKHTINTGDHPPIKQRPRRTPMHLQEEVKMQINDMLERKVIQPSTSPWSSPIVLVKKKDGTFRFCVDYRRLNQVTVGDAYPIPLVNFDNLAGSKWFTTLDLMSGYWQVEVDPKDRPKTAFACQEGLYEFNLMPFGLVNAPSTFERLMENILVGLQHKTCLVYLDDVIVFSSTFSEGIERLRQVLMCLDEAGLKLKAKKCSLFQEEVLYLGHKVSQLGVSTDPAKIKNVENWPAPTSVTELRSFLGLAAYYRRFIKDFSKIASPLHQLTEKGRKFEWSDQQEQAFQKLKQCLISAPILAYPILGKLFILDCDASNASIGAVLSQKHDDGEHVIAYGSRCLSRQERQYCVTRRELLAVVFFVKHFRHYLYGVRFLIRTDHGSLRWLFNFKEPEGQVARWIETLSTYTFEIQHRPGKQHSNADGLSRVPCKQCGMIEHTAVRNIAQNTPERVVKTPPEADSWIVGWTHELIKQKQQEDPEIAKVLQWKGESPERPNWETVSEENETIKTYWFLWKQLHIRSDLLYKLWEDPTSTSGTWQLILPATLRNEALNFLHDHVSAGHLGQHKTLARVRQRFYWHGLKNDVINWCNRCEVCATRKGPVRRGRAKLQQFPVGCPLERVALDILGPLPRSQTGNRYILIVADYFTRWTEAYAIPNQEACTVAEKFVREYICRFGAPRQILTDQGRQFESQLFRELCTLLEIGKTRTSSFHPQTDGLVERFNRTLESMLSVFVNDHQLNWDEYLPLVMMAYRSTMQETTGVSPNRMMFGREVNLPIDLIVGCPPDATCLGGSSYVLDLQAKLQQAHQHARKHCKAAAQRQKKLYDMKASGAVYNRGDFVWLFVPIKKKGLSSKLQRYWEGPYLIVHRLSDALYRIQKSPRAKCKIVHFNRLKKCKRQDRTTWLDSSDPDVRIIAQDGETEPKAEIKHNNWDSGSESSSEEDMPVSLVPQPSSESSCEINKEGPEVPSPDKSDHGNTLRDVRRPRRIIRRPKRLIEEI